MPARVRPHSGLRSLISSVHSRRTPVDAFVESDAVSQKTGGQRRSSTVGSIGGSVFRRFRRASAPSALETEIGTQQKVVEKIEFRSMFSSCDEKVRPLLEDVFNSACDMAPPALVTEARTCNSSILHTVFAHLGDTCQDCLCVDGQNRLKIICSLMARWVLDTQKALASALVEKTAREEPRGHSTELAIFTLQLKLQAASRLLNEDYITTVLGQHKPNQALAGSLENAKSLVRDGQDLAKGAELAKTKKVRFQADDKATSMRNSSMPSLTSKEVSQDHAEPDAEPSDVESPIARHMDLEGMGIEASSAINTSVFGARRKRLLGIEAKEGSISPNAQRITSQDINMEASSAINASIFRAQRRLLCRANDQREECDLDSSNLQIEASSALNASIFRNECNRIERNSKKKLERDLLASRKLHELDAGTEAHCASNSKKHRAECTSLAHVSDERRQSSSRSNSSPNLMSPGIMLRSSADSRLAKCRPARLDDDVCGRDLSYSGSSELTPSFAAW